MAVLSKFWISYIHLPNSSKKDGKQGSGPQKLDLDATPTRPSAYSYPIILHRKNYLWYSRFFSDLYQVFSLFLSLHIACFIIGYIVL
jgi:hypothetical protein